jgi:hypothetical protein
MRLIRIEVEDTIEEEVEEGRHQSHFVESSTVVPQIEPTIDYLFMASHTNISASQCVWYIDSVHYQTYD